MKELSCRSHDNHLKLLVQDQSFFPERTKINALQIQRERERERDLDEETVREKRSRRMTVRYQSIRVRDL